MNAARVLTAGLLLLALVAGCGGGDEGASGGQTEPAVPPPAAETTPEPTFELSDGEFVTMDQVKQAMDEGAALLLLDARVPEDYGQSHIAGAISLPFYEVDERYQELPTDTWIVAYCSCPTAEAEAAVEVLRTKGYEKTAVLLEGYPAWVEAGYPITTGSGE